MILDEHHYVVVDVGETELAVEAVNSAGEHLDGFTLRAEPRFGQPPPPP